MIAESTCRDDEMTVPLTVVGDQLWKRIGESMDRVEERLRKTIAILEATKIPFAVVGGNAVRIWVAQVDPGAVRSTNDVDILVRPEDLDEVKRVMAANGFRHRKAAGPQMFLEGEDDSVRNAIHVVLANRMVKADDIEPNPDVEPVEYGDGVRTLPLERLVRMKLNSFRFKDRVHLLDLIEVGLVDERWIARFPGVLEERLRGLVENPEQ